MGTFIARRFSFLPPPEACKLPITHGKLGHFTALDLAVAR